MSEQHGKPISAKFEFPSGDLQLSVYNATGSGFVDTALDPQTGTVISANPIADAEDLVDAQAQMRVMEKAAASLFAATDKAVNQNAGSRAVKCRSGTQEWAEYCRSSAARPEGYHNRLGAVGLIFVARRARFLKSPIYRHLLLVAAAFIVVLKTPLTAVSGAVEPEAPLVLEMTIPLPDVGGRIDHMTIDRGRQRLIVAALGNDTVEVIDLRTGKLLQRIRGLDEPQGVTYADNADLIFVANAGDGSVRTFHAADLAPLGRIDLHRDADNVRSDPRSGNIVVGYGNGGLAIIDPNGHAEIGTITLQAHPEGFQIEPMTGRAFVNVPDAGQIAVVDLDTRRQIATWKVPGVSGNFPMALDAAGGVLASVFRSPPRLVLLETRTGTVAAKLSVRSDADDVFFDAKRERIYVSCGGDEIAVFQGDGVSYRPLASVGTAPRARTSLFVPELDRLFVAERARWFGSDAALRVYRPVP